MSLKLTKGGQQAEKIADHAFAHPAEAREAMGMINQLARSAFGQELAEIQSYGTMVLRLLHSDSSGHEHNPAGRPAG